MEERMEDYMYAGGNDTRNERAPILRPEDLPNHYNLPSHLPTRGKKEVCADGSDRQQQRLQNLYLQQDKLLQEQRVVKINRVAIGEWNQSKQLVEVKVEKGKFWQTMGYHANGKKYLYPEEGLFLQEMNVMELSHGKVPLSVQQAYELMIPYQFSLEHYQVYCHLMRMGYITTRRIKSDISDYEYRINLDQFRHRQKQSVKKVQGWFQQMSHTKNASSTRPEVETSDGDGSQDSKSDKSNSTDSSVSFHGSGVSGKVVVRRKVVVRQSGLSSANVQMLPGSDMTSISSDGDDDKSSIYSDGPVMPLIQLEGCDAHSINLLEYHSKYMSDNSATSSRNRKSETHVKVNSESAPMLTVNMGVPESRKRKLEDSMQDIVTKEQTTFIESMKKMVAMEGENQLVMSAREQNNDGPVHVGERVIIHDDMTVKNELELITMDPLVIHKKMNKTQSKDDSGKDSESRKSSEDGSVKSVARNTNVLRVDTGELKKTYSEGSQSDAEKTRKYHCKSNKRKCSDLGIDLTVSPESVDIDDVLAILSPIPKDNRAAANRTLDYGTKYSRWNFQQISLPNIAGNDGHQQGMPLPKYLPDAIASAMKRGSTPPRSETGEDSAQVAQIVMLHELAKVSQMLQDSSELMVSSSMILGMESQEPPANDAKGIHVGGDNATPRIDSENIDNVRRLFPTKPMASNWREYKSVTSNVNHFSGITDLVQSPVAHLWQSEVQPLVRPSEAVSTSYLLHKLQIIRGANLTSQHVRWPYSTKASEDCRIAFDVYQPDSGYKKCKPGQPSFCVVVSSVKEPVPDLATQAYLLRQAGLVKLLWAVVDTNGDIAFYSLQDTEIPPDVTMGW